MGCADVTGKVPWGNFVHLMARSKAAGTELRVPEPQVEHLLFFPESHINI